MADDEGANGGKRSKTQAANETIGSAAVKGGRALKEAAAAAAPHVSNAAKTAAPHLSNAADSASDAGRDAVGRADSYMTTRRKALAVLGTGAIGIGGELGGFWDHTDRDEELLGLQPDYAARRVGPGVEESQEYNEYIELLEDPRAPTANVWGDEEMLLDAAQKTKHRTGEENPYHALDLTAEAFEFYGSTVFESVPDFDAERTQAFVRKEPTTTGAIFSGIISTLDVINFTNKIDGWYEAWGVDPKSHSEIHLKAEPVQGAGGVAIRYPGNEVWGRRSSASLTFNAKYLNDLPDKAPEAFLERPLMKDGNFVENDELFQGIKYGTNLMEWLHNAGMHHNEGRAWHTQWNTDDGFDNKTKREHYERLGFKGYLLRQEEKKKDLKEELRHEDDEEKQRELEEQLENFGTPVGRLEDEIWDLYGTKLEHEVLSYDLREDPVGVIRTTPEMSIYWLVQFQEEFNACGKEMPPVRYAWIDNDGRPVEQPSTEQEGDGITRVLLDDWTEMSHYNVSETPYAPEQPFGCTDDKLHSRMREAEKYGGTSVLFPDKDATYARDWYHELSDGGILSITPSVDQIKRAFHGEDVQPPV